jgi:hypothetical protein
MNTERDVDVKEQLARRPGASIVIAGVALVLLGYCMVTVAKHPAAEAGVSPSQAKSVVATSFIAASNAAGEASSMPVKEETRSAKPGDVQADPRECEPAKGINTQCVFE